MGMLYNNLVKELLAWRGMHRARAQQYGDANEAFGSDGGVGNTTTTGLDRQNFTIEMDLVANATKERLYDKVVARMNKKKNKPGVRKTLMGNIAHKAGQSVMVGKAKEVDTHQLEATRRTLHPTALAANRKKGPRMSH